MAALVASFLAAQATDFSALTPSGPATSEVQMTLPLAGTPSVTYIAVLSAKLSSISTPTPATYAVALGSGTYVDVPEAGFASLALPALGQVSMETPTSDGLSLIRIDHGSPLGTPLYWYLRISTGAAAAATPFVGRIAHTLAETRSPAFSLRSGADFFTDNIPGPLLPLAAAAVDFGSVPAGGSSTHFLQLLNSGTGPLSLDSATVSLDPFGAYSVKSLVPGTVLAPNSFEILEVTFAPVSPSAGLPGTLDVASQGGPASFSIALTGSSVVAPPPSSPTPTGGKGCGLGGLEALLLLLLAGARRRPR